MNGYFTPAFITFVILLAGTMDAHAQGEAVEVQCGSPPLNETYCYINNDSQTWTYTAAGTGTLKLVFDLGTIESAIFDGLAIYDGIDATGDLLFMHIGGQANLGPPGSAINNTNTNYHAIDVTSTTGSLFMEMYSDGSVQCVGSSTYDPWEWRVFCLDCTVPVLYFEVIDDCENFQYVVEVNIEDLGSAQELTITNSVNVTAIPVTQTGLYTVGPFPSGTPVQITVVHGDDMLCNIVSPVLMDPFCPTLVCGSAPLVETYCYTASDDQFWAYAVPGNGQVRITFNLGTMESSTFDHLRIHDGPDADSPVIFDHTQAMASDFGPSGSAINGPGNFYYGIDVVSSGPDIYMVLTSDGSVQCQGSTTYDPMEWEVRCEGCQPPGLEYLIEPDCAHLQFGVAVNITELNGPLGLQITELTSGESITATVPDIYSFSSAFALDTSVHVQVVDLDDAGCIYDSGPLMHTRDSCVITSCGLDNYEVCYENDDELWYTFKSEGDYPVALYFLQGHLLENDVVTIYNGVINTTQNVIFNGNMGGNLSGLTVNSANPDNALTLRISSDGLNSCADGQAVVPLTWDIGCGFVGIGDLQQTMSRIFPNPTQGAITVELNDTDDEILAIRVMDMSGRSVYAHMLSGSNDQQISMDLGMLYNGQYILQIITADRIATHDLQIMR